jgi:replication-associated recombination protein RarA
MFTDDVRFRECDAIVERVEELAEETGCDKSEVYRRLVRLGLDDIGQIGASALNIPDTPGQK